MYNFRIPRMRKSQPGNEPGIGPFNQAIYVISLSVGNDANLKKFKKFMQSLVPQKVQITSVYILGYPMFYSLSNSKDLMSKGRYPTRITKLGNYGEDAPLISERYWQDFYQDLSGSKPNKSKPP